MKRTPQKVARAVRLYGAGKTTREIADRLEVNQSTVARWLRRGGAQMRPQRGDGPVSTERIVQLRDQGLSFLAIATAVDMSASGVHRRYSNRDQP